ncbi:hypothetical protein L2E82_19683 [Cichorium intybus]|uniref:Uncharacterized protein n=1 Tax=Cichorium intybus TaxID=13427 RepID=A0ACB9FCQ8_CICIN|nr:hypothetical protein L2E82_19683 [Cichorium intybus]
MGRVPCCDKENVKRGPWSPEEDAKLKSFIDKYSNGGNWIALPHKAACMLALVAGPTVGCRDDEAALILVESVVVQVVPGGAVGDSRRSARSVYGGMR